jgi:hypothetical protein
VEQIYNEMNLKWKILITPWLLVRKRPRPPPVGEFVPTLVDRRVSRGQRCRIPNGR